MSLDPGADTAKCTPAANRTHSRLQKYPSNVLVALRDLRTLLYNPDQ